MNYLKSENFIEFCHKIFDKLPMSIDIVNEKCEFIYVNNTFADFFKMTQEELIGKNIYEVHPSSTFKQVLDTKKALIASKHKFENGKEAAVVHIIPILNNYGKVLGGIGMILFDDVGEMKELMDKYEKLDKEVKLLRNEIAKINKAKYNLNSIVGNSPAIQECKNQVKKMVKVNSNVIIYGESGVGKELFAHSIHNESDRRYKPFVSVNCSAIPETLMESELFGYEEGAFTGAKKGGNIGKFELANGGSIFLDEIGEMPMYLQAKLLRVLQEKEVQRVGGKKTIQIDARVISATNKDLKIMVEKGKFREDLYYRLNVLSLEVPPLRKRKSDINLLVRNFVGEFYKETGLYRQLNDEVIKILSKYEWPGNIRELKNIVEKTCVSADDVNVSIKDIPSDIINDFIKKESINNNTGLKNIMMEIEKELIIKALIETKGNKRKAADKLDIPRSSLYRELEEYNIYM